MKDKDLEKTYKMAKIISDTVEILEGDRYEALREAFEPFGVGEELLKSKVNTREQMQIAIAGIRQDISEYLTYNGYSEKMHDAISDIIDKHSKL
jgi:hypothetical protein